ncbi:alanine--tRNA ligase, chloroplastic/mitochondrial-like isoform X1 [Musa acuminata AAA Group]|uniref:alanine--tRNA ligase, chloroplastic/mitochondrial-like isoform X1 n=1 Tax=Musa acuminata AAA Group TaxID=214697 RepID=UPI0031E24F73
MGGLQLVESPIALRLVSAASRPRRRLSLATFGHGLRPFRGCNGMICVSNARQTHVEVSSTYLYKLTSPKKVKFSTRSTSASVQPMTQDITEDMHKDYPISGDEIRTRFLNFYASRGHKILPSASLVPDDPTVLLTIAGMLQFKPIFLGKEPRSVPCATTSQRCIRTNDVENVGKTTRHHTFFEMLGNFSFGDYFKKEAIVWAWELTTKEYKLPPERLWISVFKDDDEAFSIWHDEVGVPKEHIKRLGEDDNFWTSGITGPCGPCSEIYYDFHPDRGSESADLGDDSRFIEFYNLVFMQYNKKDDGSLEPLKQKNIDTGMGLERMARILQQVPNNYETDLIFPIIQKAANLAMISYAKADDATKTNLKIVGDHMRAVVYLISDAVLPSNIGRGYVVRRLIRRVVRIGRLLGIKGAGEGNPDGAFLPGLAKTVIELSNQIDPDVTGRMPHILEELKREELRFVQTLERGEKLLDQFLASALLNASTNGDRPCLAGKDVFLLYDTYGFPVEITAEVAEERGVSLDMNGFHIEMENQRRQSQAAHSQVKLSVGNEVELAESVPDTEFLGYDMLSANAIIKGLLQNGEPVTEVAEGSDVEIMLDRTPFYAESGGQIGDNGFLRCKGVEDSKDTAIVEVKDVQKSLGNIFVHKGTIKEGKIEVGLEVNAIVDPRLRQRAKVHHTATHLLQAALKDVIGQETSQAGSLVAFDRLRFDFNFHRPLFEHELIKIEELINQWISDSTLLQTKVMPLLDAKKAGAIAMFGEKYGEQVRVVEVPRVSMELCGGTHVSNTSEIRGFKIISEQGIASGIRRIEAVAGEAFIEYVTARDNSMRHLCSVLKVKAEDVTGRVENILEELRIARNEVSALRTRVAILKATALVNKAFIVGTTNIRVVVEFMDDTDADSLRNAAEYLVDSLQDPAAVVLGSCPGDGKVSLVAAFTPSVVKMGIQAGKFIGGIAKLCGGGGGGKPNFAQAGGRKPENLSNALEKARVELIAALDGKTS